MQKDCLLFLFTVPICAGSAWFCRHAEDMEPWQDQGSALSRNAILFRHEALSMPQRNCSILRQKHQETAIKVQFHDIYKWWELGSFAYGIQGSALTFCKVRHICFHKGEITDPLVLCTEFSILTSYTASEYYSGPRHLTAVILYPLWFYELLLVCQGTNIITWTK